MTTREIPDDLGIRAVSVSRTKATTRLHEHPVYLNKSSIVIHGGQNGRKKRIILSEKLLVW